MAWCHQAGSNYVDQCCPEVLSPYGITRPKLFNVLIVDYRQHSWSDSVSCKGQTIAIQTIYLVRRFIPREYIDTPTVVKPSTSSQYNWQLTLHSLFQSTFPVRSCKYTAQEGKWMLTKVIFGKSLECLFSTAISPLVLLSLLPLDCWEIRQMTDCFNVPSFATSVWSTIYIACRLAKIFIDNY